MQFKSPLHAIWIAFLIAAYFAISNDRIWNEFVGRLFSGAAGPKLSEAPAPLYGTTLSVGDQQVLAMNNLDTNAAKAFKQVTGLIVEPYRKPMEAAFAERVAAAGNGGNESGSDSADADDAMAKDDAAKEAAAPQNNGAPLSNNELTARNNAAAAKASGGGAASFLQPGPVVGFAGKVKDPDNQDVAERYVEALRPKLPSGFVTFATQDPSGNDIVAVVKATDPFEPVRIVGTTGGSILHPRGTEEIITKLRDWNSRYPLHILEVKGDTVVAILDKPLENPNLLGHEVKEFAPGDGSANADDFVQDIRDNKRIFMWWD